MKDLVCSFIYVALLLSTVLSETVKTEEKTAVQYDEDGKLDDPGLARYVSVGQSYFVKMLDS